MKPLIVTVAFLLSLSTFATDGKPFFVKWGDFNQITLPAISMYLNSKEGRLSETIFSYTSMAITVQALKSGFDRTSLGQRPNGGKRGFPSGHTSSAFYGLYSIHKKKGWSWSIPSFLIATSVGWSRVQYNYHYIHDVIAGALLSVYWDATVGQNIRLSLISKDGKASGFSLEYHF